MVRVTVTVTVRARVRLRATFTPALAEAGAVVSWRACERAPVGARLG